MSYYPAYAQIDLSAISNNVRQIRAKAPSSKFMAVVKADAYGHGLVPSAQAALDGGADYLGVAQVSEALRLRQHGITAPLLTWIYSTGAPFEQLIDADIEIGVSSLWALKDIATAAAELGKVARVHLKIDTGLGRSGLMPDAFAAIADYRDELGGEHVKFVGIFSHLAYGEEYRHPVTEAQIEAFEAAIQFFGDRGMTFELRHLANSAATLSDPRTHYDMVRSGIAVFGISPFPHRHSSADLGLRQAMRLVAKASITKTLPEGHGVSYNHTYHTETGTTLLLVPLGYADGIPRHASRSAQVWVDGQRYRIAGTVCMDQFAIDLYDLRPDLRAGTEVVLFGNGDDGEPTAQDWAVACDTIAYEIVTRLGPRVPRVYVGGKHQ